MSKDTPNFRGHFPLTTRRRKKRVTLQKWRRPRGIDSTLKECRGAIPKVGYGHKKDVKYNHPSGYKEILVKSKKDILNIIENKEKVVIRFSSTLGLKKKNDFKKLAKENNIKTLN